MEMLTSASIFAVVVHVRIWPLLGQLAHAFFVTNHWSKWSQHKAYGISKFGTGVWAKAWTSNQWLLTCTTTANSTPCISTSLIIQSPMLKPQIFCFLNPKFRFIPLYKICNTLIGPKTVRRDRSMLEFYFYNIVSAPPRGELVSWKSKWRSRR